MPTRKRPPAIATGATERGSRDHADSIVTSRTLCYICAILLQHVLHQALAMTTTPPSLRRLWTLYKQTLAESGEYDRRDLVIAQGAFYAAARATYKLLGQLVERGQTDELTRLITRQANQVKAIQKSSRRKQPH